MLGCQKLQAPCCSPATRAATRPVAAWTVRTPRSLRAAAAASAPETSYAESLQQKRRLVLEETKELLAGDLRRLFGGKGSITTSRYASDITFEDPIAKYSSLDGYLLNLNLLRSLFSATYELHTLDIAEPDQLVARWTMTMQPWLLPWRPKLVFTGKSFYQVDPDTGIILSHRDTWDAVSNNQFPSLEALVHVIQQALDVSLTPDLESPDYEVLKRSQGYEVRRYSDYLVAEVPMPPGAGLAAGTGFTELAGYIFGSNSQGAKMEMTTPVFTRTGAARPPSSSSRSSSAPTTSSSSYTSSAGRAPSAGVSYSDPNQPSMQFMMEKKFADVSLLPDPIDGRVTRKRERGRYVAAVQFSGWPVEFEVAAAERQLRSALLRDGLQPAQGYSLARYNEPTVPPFLRRNEVLIDLEEFTWP